MGACSGACLLIASQSPTRCYDVLIQPVVAIFLGLLDCTAQCGELALALSFFGKLNRVAEPSGVESKRVVWVSSVARAHGNRRTDIPGRYHSGMGFSLLSFDWNQIAFIGSPLATPCTCLPICFSSREWPKKSLKTSPCSKLKCEFPYNTCEM